MRRPLRQKWTIASGQIRERKAEYVNQDPRPLEDGDYAVVHLKSVAGVEGNPIDNDDMMLHIADPETFPEFTENLRGVPPGEEREFDVKYPDDYGQEQLAGKVIRFLATVKGVRKKESPEINDDFARDLGDYQNVEELRDAVRRSILAEKTYAAQEEAKTKLIDKLVENHEFEVPEVYIDRQTEIGIENRLRGLAAAGRRSPQPEARLVEAEGTLPRQGDPAMCKASLLLERRGRRRSRSTPPRMRWTRKSSGSPSRNASRLPPRARTRRRTGVSADIASHIRTEKTLNFLFENARKVPKPRLRPSRPSRPKNSGNSPGSDRLAQYLTLQSLRKEPTKLMRKVFLLSFLLMLIVVTQSFFRPGRRHHEVQGDRAVRRG